MNDAIYQMMKAGAAWQKSGGKASPAMDPVVLAAIRGKQVGESFKIFDAWTTGWHMANLGEEL